MEKRHNHDFKDYDEVEAKGCRRCNNYRGYGLYKIRDLPEGKVLWGIRVYCKLKVCEPDLKPISCGYCGCDLEKSLEKVEDKEQKGRLREIEMCSNCYEGWREECLCLLCHFDYPASSLPGRKGNYCFCQGCEWNHRCPEKRKMFDDCQEHKEIPSSKVDEITQLI